MPEPRPKKTEVFRLGALKRAVRRQKSECWVPVENEQNAWLCGYAAALSSLIRTHDQPGLAKSIMDCDGLTRAMFKRAGVEEYDLGALKKAR